jgi:hypothetical protein
MATLTREDRSMIVGALEGIAAIRMAEASTLLSKLDADEEARKRRLGAIGEHYKVVAIRLREVARCVSRASSVNFELEVRG